MNWQFGRGCRVMLALVGLVLAAAACSRSSTKVIYVTATPLYDDAGNVIIPPTMTEDRPTNTPLVPTPNPTRPAVQQDSGLYAVQPGDTLGTIAQLYGLTVEQITAVNTIADPNALEVGQLLTIPGGSLPLTPNTKLIPDSELVYGPTANGFSIAGAIKFRQGFLKAYSEAVDDEVWSGVEIISFVAQSYSINPRLLLALLEYRGGWLNTPYPTEAQIAYPLGMVEAGREGLLRQLLDAADALNYAYYGYKYRGTVMLTLLDGQRLFYAPDLNPGTVAVQYMLSRTADPAQWQRDMHPDGFFQTYLALFGDPFVSAVEPITPSDLVQPALTLPFARGEEWVFTGGPHGAYNSGSAWGAVDFAPPEPPEAIKLAQGECYVSPNWVTAAAPGIIARSGEGYVVLDLDGDGNEHTGWTLVHLHMDDDERIPQGMRVQAGDKLAHPSCQGGFSNGTHLHLSRRYNGEWIPVACEDCAPGVTVPPFVLGEWTMVGLENQEYQGYMTRPGEDGYRQAEQTRDYAFNKVMW
jgi:murein DD-endopeptidase MepM/ murein hydrolase activator NlpD